MPTRPPVSIPPRTALVRTLLAGAAVLMLVGVALTAQTPRSTALMWAIVALGIVQLVREAVRYAHARRSA